MPNGSKNERKIKTQVRCTVRWCSCSDQMYSCSFYGLEAFQLNKSHISSIDFVINRFFMKMFNTNNIEIVKCCQQEFCFNLPSVTLARRPEIFLNAKLGSVRIFLSKDSCVCKLLYFVTLPAIDVFILTCVSI